jgi:hypothetical protein
MTEKLTTLINKIIKHNKMPEEWRRSELTLLFKKGDKNRQKATEV